MRCKITRNAAKVLKKELDKPENEGKKIRVHVLHAHLDHAHYGLSLDVPTDRDEVVFTDKGIDVLLNKDDPWLDGVIIDYLYIPYERFVITNPSKGYHGDH